MDFIFVVTRHSWLNIDLHEYTTPLSLTMLIQNMCFGKVESGKLQSITVGFNTLSAKVDFSIGLTIVNTKSGNFLSKNYYFLSNKTTPYDVAKKLNGALQYDRLRVQPHHLS